MVIFKDFSRLSSVFQVLFKANLIFKDFSRQTCTVSHFSYAPPFLTKMLESNSLYDYLIIDIFLFDEIEKIPKSLIILQRQRQF